MFTDDDGGVVRFAFADIQEAHKRRYLFRDTALELFSNDGRDHLLVFATQVSVSAHPFLYWPLHCCDMCFLLR